MSTAASPIDARKLFAIIKEDYLDTEKSLPIVINGMLFTLYVMCFVSLYKPYLELIGYGLFFTLHIIMSFGIMKNIMSIKDPFNFAEWINTKPWPFSLIYYIPCYISIPISLILLFVSFILLLLTFSKLRAKHTSATLPVLPGFISGGSGEVISGYTYKYKGTSGATNGSGYYLNSGDGTDFYFNDNVTKTYVNNFTIIAITTTVLIWAQYLLYANYELFNALLLLLPISRNWGSSIIAFLFILFGATIIALSSVCVWLTTQVNNRTIASQDPESALESSNNSGQNAQSSSQPTTIYGQIQQMLKTIGL
jgi:hypothetical protein